MLQSCSELPSQKVHMYGYVLHTTNGESHGQTLKIQWFFLNKTLYGHPLAGFWWERRFEEVLLEFGWLEVPNWDCLSVCR